MFLGGALGLRVNGLLLRMRSLLRKTMRSYRSATPLFIFQGLFSIAMNHEKQSNVRLRQSVDNQQPPVRPPTLQQEPLNEPQAVQDCPAKNSRRAGRLMTGVDVGESFHHESGLAASNSEIRPRAAAVINIVTRCVSEAARCTRLC